MKRMQSILLGILLIGGTIPQSVLSNIITIENLSGQKIELGVDVNDRFLDVLNQIQTYFQEERLAASDQKQTDEIQFLQQNFQWNLKISHAGMTAVRAKREKRNYHIPVTASEKKDIAYIITTLAFDGLIDIGLQQSSLEEIGKRLHHLHPFHFLMTIFTNEKLKVGAAAIRERTGLVKDRFFNGIIGSLGEESENQNLLPFVKDFAEKVKINVALILPALEKKKWKEFINILIDKIPREEDPNRYNM